MKEVLTKDKLERIRYIIYKELE